MYVAVVPNRSSPPAILLRESYREGGKVKTRTLANLTGWAPERVEALRQALKGGAPESGAPIERALAARHLGEATLVLYDLTSAAIEGRRCPLARLGYARDGVRGRAQIEFGLLTTTDGLPVAVEVFAGNTSDPASLASQVAKLKERFGLLRGVGVGDRGMITATRIRGDLQPAGRSRVIT